MNAKTINLMIISVFLTACSSSTNQWIEEVQVTSDLGITTVQRKTRILRVFLAEGTGSVQQQWFTYAPLKITWETSDLAEIPISFDIINNSPYLVTMITINQCMTENGLPTGIRIINWKGVDPLHITVTPSFLSNFKYNLYQNYKGSNSTDDTHGYVTVSAKRNGWLGGSNADVEQGKPLIAWILSRSRYFPPCK